MSLEALTRLRQRRLAPEFVWVLVGNPPKYMEQNVTCIHVRPHQRPEDIDWRPLVGLHVALIECREGLPLVERVSSAIDACNPKSQSVTCSAGTVALTLKHEVLLNKAREILCR